MAKTGIVTDTLCVEHDMGRLHPETPKRLQVLLDLVNSKDVTRLSVEMIPGRPAVQEEITRVHEEAYFRRVMGSQGRTVVMDIDTTAGPMSFEAAMMAAGCAITATESVVAGRVKNAFALIRPPGHHAEPGRSAGFCLFNNMAVAVRHAVQTLDVKRIAVVDFDLHHGNGTQKVFYQDKEILYVSTHQFPFYPGTGAAEEVGEGDGVGTTINIPLAAGHGDHEYEAIYGGLIPRILEQFKPELIMVSAGYDIAAQDPLGFMEVSAQGMGRITTYLRAAADRICDGKIVLILEGGYSLSALRDGVLASIKGLVGKGKGPAKGKLDDLHIGDARRHLSTYRQFFKLK
ncbi:MAG: histone deacetylase [Deltaproteobacteria bacterium]|nr:histone deacetylase [Deltaproteobacteria bacterium]